MFLAAGYGIGRYIHTYIPNKTSIPAPWIALSLQCCLLLWIEPRLIMPHQAKNPTADASHCCVGTGSTSTSVFVDFFCTPRLPAGGWPREQNHCLCPCHDLSIQIAPAPRREKAADVLNQSPQLRHGVSYRPLCTARQFGADLDFQGFPIYKENGDANHPVIF